MSGIDIEREEYLTELLIDLYDKWKSCADICGTKSEKKDVFFEGIRRHLEKGFSILSEPGIYHDEDGLESLSNDLYEKWKDYVWTTVEDTGVDEDDFDLSVNSFIAIAKIQLDDVQKKKDTTNSWQDIDNKIE